MRRSRVFSAVVALLVSVSLPGSVLAACAADATDAATAQMACCKAGHHECGDSVDARDCCQTSDHPQQSSLAKPIPVAKPLHNVAASLALNTTPWASTSPRESGGPILVLFAGTTSPPRLLFSVLLI